MNSPKYTYPTPIPITNREWPDRIINHPPRWCSVDLRDGNQALPIPMDPDTKLQFFQLLVKIGFKEIEIGFPSASQDDYDFVRTLIEGNHIPEDVTISVLTQARQHLIDRTVESLQGVHRAILHLYVATSDLHGELVFGKNREGVKSMAIEGTQMVKTALAKAHLSDKVWYEFSPEEFTDSDLDFVVDVCNAVKETWGPSQPQTFILNLPATVERRPPYQYADMIELFTRKYKYMNETCISLHAHNDQGCAVAATEMALLAGATRVEGTLFGHGERTGNVDIITLAMNLFSRGVSIGLNFSNMQDIVKIVETASGITVHPRHPYSGSLVFTAFSGSHQDAIRKGLDHLGELGDRFEQAWKVPYLHVDPADLGRVYEKLIRINSQSGKGGVAYVLEHDFGVYAPKAMHPEIGSVVQTHADLHGGEISADQIMKLFKDTFVDVEGPFLFKSMRRITEKIPEDKIGVRINVEFLGKDYTIEGVGNGPISAAANAMTQIQGLPEFSLEDFSEQTLGKTAEAVALAFVGIRLKSNNALVHGAGQNVNIDWAAVIAMICSINRAIAKFQK